MTKKTNIGEFLTRRAYLNPTREAFVDSLGSQRFDFVTLNQRANQTANALAERGIGHGDRVGLLLMNGVEFLECYFGLAKLGVVVVPLNWRLVADELEFILKDSGTTALVFGAEFDAVAEDLRGRGDKTDLRDYLRVTADDTALPFSADYATLRQAASTDEPAVTAGDDDHLFIMYTSGTTGLPKGVVHSHNTVLWAVLTIAATVDMRDGDRYLAALPLFHVGALTPIIVDIYLGVTTIMMREFDPLKAWQLFDSEAITTGLLVPAMLNFMLQVPGAADFPRPHLRWLLSGASPLPVNLIRAYEAIGVEVQQIYGLTETGGPACAINGENALSRAGSTGKAFFHTDVKVANPDGSEVPRNTQGEVWVRGAHNMIGYWQRPDANAEVLVDGWLRTGDVAVMDDEGFVYIQDRIKDMIISGGENVYPAEIENIITGHAGVAEVAVIGQPSERWGESPFAVVVPKDGDLDEADVMRYCDGKLARFKMPKGVAFIDVLPRNPSGKVLKRLLREQFPGPAPE